MKKVAILQSNYIPWKGVFDMINMVDVFVFFEDVDFTKRDWRNRNRIKSPNPEAWLTVPVKKAPRGTKIHDIEIAESSWQHKHFKTIETNYRKSKYFDQYLWILEKMYIQNTWTNLSEMNIFFTKLISEELGINTHFINSKNIYSKGNKDEKLINICKEIGATSYLSGPSAKNYIDEENFRKQGVELEYIKYDYPKYPQLYGEFDHHVSVLDVLFNCGNKSQEYILRGTKS